MYDSNGTEKWSRAACGEEFLCRATEESESGMSPESKWAAHKTNDTIFCAAPSGRDHYHPSNLGLVPGAILCRLSGTPQMRFATETN